MRSVKCFVCLLGLTAMLLGGLMTTYAASGAGNPDLVVILRGTDIGYAGTVPDIDGDGADDTALCFDVNLIDAHMENIIGTASDCLPNVTPTGAGDQVDLNLVGTTFFRFPQGLLVLRGNTAVRDAGGLIPGFTHTTGAHPGGVNNVLSGTERFAGATGGVRLSGLVAMAPQPDGSLQITFDCVFIINLD